MRFFIVLIGLIFIFSCKKDPAGPVDCLGVSGGSAELDNCGTCDADSQNDCVDCASHFVFNQSMNQAAYFITSVIINGNPIEPDDLVGAFNGKICVGAKEWDTADCNNEICSINVNGNDGSSETTGYCSSGDIPVFKIYDVSEGSIYNTNATDSITPWQNNSFPIIDTLEATTAAPCQ